MAKNRLGKERKRRDSSSLVWYPSVFPLVVRTTCENLKAEKRAFHIYVMLWSPDNEQQYHSNADTGVP